ncbi:YciI family protein [Litorimonas haliclonae]|uniref:YciI family protein n=1 Tax=Litorimonas haliclonae TaxID=2081977 RepID=UPI0039F06DD5
MPKADRVARLEKPTYMFTCLDGEKTPPLREKHLFGHLDHIEANNEHYRVAGPIRRNADGDIFGSFFLVAADSEEKAWDIMRGDPYISSDMYESVTVCHFAPACGQWLGGVIWDQDEIRADIEKYT